MEKGKMTVIELQTILANKKKNNRVIPNITTNDGTTLSVQASQYHYCSPRKDNALWNLVEVGYPSVSPEGIVDWAQYFDGDWYNDNHTSSVYGYVPIESVVEYINYHGGFKLGGNE
jgi:hypothetical protein